MFLCFVWMASSSSGRTAASAAVSDENDYNVRRYAYHVYFAYSVALFGAMGVLNMIWPGSLVSFFGWEGEVGPMGTYFARQSGAAQMVLAVVTLYGWKSNSGPVKDLVLKSHFAHQLFTMLIDWHSVRSGFAITNWQQGLLSPHPFFTFLVLFLWMTDKSRDHDAEAKEAAGKTL